MFILNDIALYNTSDCLLFQSTFLSQIIIWLTWDKNCGNEKSIRPLKQAAANIKFLNLGPPVLLIYLLL